MVKPARFSYLSRGQQRTEGALPYLPLTLQRKKHSVSVMALVDSGASVNVLPYSVGIRLGAVWEKQTAQVQLGGNLANTEARGLLVTATVPSFAPVRLAFAWAKSDNCPVILGQMNFFQEFNVCFFRSKLTFEVLPSQSTS